MYCLSMNIESVVHNHTIFIQKIINKRNDASPWFDGMWFESMGVARVGFRFYNSSIVSDVFLTN